MRLMSFTLTTPQILARTKTVTRRIGWTFLKSGDLIQAIEKGQGLKKGEKVRRLAVLRVVDVRREPLGEITKVDVEHEGFPGRTVDWFCHMFIDSHGMESRREVVTRIEFKYADQPALRESA